MSNESAKFNLMGQTLLLVWRSGAVKVFALILTIIAIVCVVFAFLINPWVTFGSFMIIAIALLVFLGKLLPKRPELFQDGQTWLSYQKFQEGDKQKGLHEASIDGEIVQPTIVRQNITGRARIVRGNS